MSPGESDRGRGSGQSGSDEKSDPPASRTPGQAEGEDEDTRRDREDDSNETLHRRRPSQAEGEDEADEADRVPPEDQP